MECYEVARRYALERIQFDKPIASFQLVQKKLAEMLADRRWFGFVDGLMGNGRAD